MPNKGSQKYLQNCYSSMNFQILNFYKNEDEEQ